LNLKQAVFLSRKLHNHFYLSTGLLYIYNSQFESIHAKSWNLGGGQLGRMLLQQAANYPVDTWVLENDPECPAAHLCHHFVKGIITDYEDVYAFGKNLDALTIEIESVNIEALEVLEKEGVKIYPRPSALRIIKNKIQQKNFYQKNSIPTAAYLHIDNRYQLEQQSHFLPAVQKLAEGGYDGRGVQVIKGESDFTLGFDAPGILEKLIAVQKEIAVIVGINDKGDSALFPPVEMVFNPDLNLLDYQVCPAGLPETLLWRVEAIALKVAKCLNSPGLYAVEFLIDDKDTIYVNETAPRVHNSGHHTIEANYSSQYDMLWRIILGYPFGNTRLNQSSALVNLIGDKDCHGSVKYEGLQEILGMENTFVHLYGKKVTKPGRKMGHVTLVGHDRADLIRKAHQVKKIFRVIAGL
jgi:5-(carboxyamino)imidazole ribonucleotide synthase